MDENPAPACFCNMQHAIVEAMHELGAFSPFNDGSVRMKELFSKVENAPIEIDGVVSEGPHRFSIFHSALCGRRSAAELFERVEDAERPRQGAWWKLKMPYDQAIDFSKEQKSIKTAQARPRHRQEPPAFEFEKISQPVLLSKWNKNAVLETLERIKSFGAAAAALRDENARLKEKSAQLDDEIEQLRQTVPQEVLDMLDVYQAARSRVNQLKQQVLEAQEALQTLSDQAIQLQD